MPTVTHPPPTLWAQRKSKLFVTIEVAKFNVDDISASGKTLHIKGKTSEGEDYDSKMELFDEVSSEIKKNKKTERHVELTLTKTKEEWWPRLLADKSKQHWLKVDFDKWVDEDDQDAEFAGGASSDFDINQMLANMGGGAGMGGMDFGAGGMPDVPDSDDDDMPGLEDADDDKKKDTDEDVPVVDAAQPQSVS